MAPIEGTQVHVSPWRSCRQGHVCETADGLHALSCIAGGEALLCRHNGLPAVAVIQFDGTVVSFFLPVALVCRAEVSPVSNPPALKPGDKLFYYVMSPPVGLARTGHAPALLSPCCVKPPFVGSMPVAAGNIRCWACPLWHS